MDGLSRREGVGRTERTRHNPRVIAFVCVIHFRKLRSSLGFVTFIDNHD